MFEQLYEKIRMSLDEGIASAREKYVKTEKIPEDVFNDFIDGDPSATKKYLEWMCREYSGTSRPPTVEDLETVVQQFEVLAKKKQIEQTDIYSYTFKEAQQAVKEKEHVKTKTQKKKEIKYKDATKTYEDDRILVLAIYSWEAAKLYGSGGDWCIRRQESNDMWISQVLNKQNNVFFVIIKEDFDGDLFSERAEGEEFGSYYKKGEKFAVLIYAHQEDYPKDTSIDVWSQRNDEIGDNWKHQLNIFQKDLGIPEPDENETVFYSGYDWLYEQRYEILSEATYKELKSEIYSLFHDVHPDEYVFVDVEEAEISNAYIDKIIDDVYRWLSEHVRHFEEEPDDISSGYYIEREDLIEALLELDIIISIEDVADEEGQVDPEKWKELKLRKDLPGQLKLPFEDAD